MDSQLSLFLAHERHDKVRITLVRPVTLVTLGRLVQRIWSYAHRCLVKHAYLNLCGNINGIDEIAGGFTSKVDFRNLLKIMFNLSMLQKASKRRSPNPFIYQLK